MQNSIFLLKTHVPKIVTYNGMQFQDMKYPVSLVQTIHPVLHILYLVYECRPFQLQCTSLFRLYYCMSEKCCEFHSCSSLVLKTTK